MMLYQEFSSGMQRYARALALVLVAGLAASSFAFALSYFVSAWDTATNRIAPRQLSVSGEGKIAVRPDTAVFTAGVLTQAKKVGEAQADNSRRSNAVLVFLKKQGIEEMDIKTIGYFVQPQYGESPVCLSFPCPPRRPPEITGYEVRHTLEVKVRKLDQTDVLLEGVVTAGANEIGSISFRVDDDEAVRVEARKKAIEDAEKKAKKLARDLGVRLGRVAGFSESGAGFPLFAHALKGGFGGDVVSAPALEIAPGEQEIRSTVTITYEFR
jgi:hypothetical protein